LSAPNEASVGPIGSFQVAIGGSATVKSLRVLTIKAGRGKNAKKETVLVLQFSEALNAATADNVDAYELAPIFKVDDSGKRKNHKPTTSRVGSPEPVASAAYDRANNRVTLYLRSKLTASKPEELIVNGALLSDWLDRGIDGANDGQNGSDYIATVTGTRVSAGGIPLVRTARRPATVVDAVDQLLAGGDLAVPRRPARVLSTPDRVEL
jgi:hypothetical protein